MRNATAPDAAARQARPCGHCRISSGFRLRLDRLDVLDEALDTSGVNGIPVVEAFENGPPHRHVARAVSRRREPLLSRDERRRTVNGEHAATSLGDRRQIRRWHLERGGGVTSALAVATMAGRTVMLKQVPTCQRRSDNVGVLRTSRLSGPQGGPARHERQRSQYSAEERSRELYGNLLHQLSVTPDRLPCRPSLPSSTALACR